MRIKYFDNAATTKLDESLLPIIKQYNTEYYFNPSALSSQSTQVSKNIKEAKEVIANTIGAISDQITFTSCGTEGDNTAILSSIKGFKGNIITSQVEHSAVYNTAIYLQSKGVEVRFVDLLQDGRADITSLEKLIDQNTQFVCLMHVNNETGAINDIKKLCQVTKELNPRCKFICDGVQAYGKIKVNVKNLGVDFYVASGHKINAPKGIGFLYHKNNNYAPLLRGGSQENGLRAGTENTPNIMAFSKACQMSVNAIDDNILKYKIFKDTILDILSNNCEDYKILTDSENCAPNILSIFFANIKTEVLLHMVEENGFIFGTGSACNSKNKTSRVISALKIEPKYKEGLVRISFDKHTLLEDVKEFAIILSESVKKLRITMHK